MSSPQSTPREPATYTNATSSASPDPNPPTVIYDSERLPPLTPDSLEPPDIDSILSRKRKWYRAVLALELPRTWQVGLTGLSICLSALQANGVGPEVAKRLDLSGTEAQTIVVGGILGVYLMAAPLGSLTDRYGPRFGSFVSAILSAMGYLSFATILSAAEPGTPMLHLYLTASYFCVGAATVGSYFACLTCASLSFPSHPTLSLSVPLSLIGLSSLVISSFSNLPAFLTPSRELDPKRFLLFLGIFSPAINLWSALFMKIIPQPIQLHHHHHHEHLPYHDDPEQNVTGNQNGAAVAEPTPEPEPESETFSDDDDDSVASSPISELLHLSEHTPLLIGGPEAAREEAEAMVHGKDVKWTAWSLVKDWEGFWAFGILLALCIGPGEMIIASIGSILTSLLPPTIRSSLVAWTASSHPLSLLSTRSVSALSPHPGPNALALRNKHVSLLSLTGTVARLLVGITADYLAPPPTAVPAPPSDDPNAPTHLFVQKKKVRLRRSTFAALCALALAAVLAWSAGWLEEEPRLWVLSAGTGMLYGALFTLTPAIVSAHFGPTNFGLAWGMVSYFAAVGAVLFSYLFALVSTAVAEQADVIPGTSGPSILKADEAPCAVSSLPWGSSCSVGGGKYERDDEAGLELSLHCSVNQ
ncbi:putative monocarboxylate transporter mch1 [Saitozyma podzolica]|uniref:Putative monocarboxylate transporter mch1 n=1 Tax=Saitozyma podzolica TaxID=1890683 RepID=A0A427XYW7_9TREE|nr:putative monocarboxylate transporter mch1 [Saitozyma podzolica]